MAEALTRQMTFPGRDWERARPEELGLEREKLEQAADTVFTIDKRFGFLVARSGVIAYERYLRDASATNHIFSITKGLGATLIGIAQRQGLLHVDDLVSDWLPVHHPDIGEGATIGHVLNMTANRGRDGTGGPGTWWAYNSNEILNSLTGILWLASGMPPHEFYRQHLQKPLRLGFDWPHNARGWIQIGSQGPLPVIEATHRDIARLGHLWMNGGRWDGEQIVDPAFVEAALRAPYPDINGAYGYLWWLNRGDGTWRTTGGASGTGSWFPEMAENVFLALGARGKIMVVVPDHDLIVVTMGDTPQEQSGNYLGTIMGAAASLLRD